jgi:hypothetical protein
MSDEIQVISAANLPANGKPQYSQSGNDAVMIPNYGTINMQITQQTAAMPYFGGNIYLPPKGGSGVLQHICAWRRGIRQAVFKIPRDRALNQCMTKETMESLLR